MNCRGFQQDLYDYLDGSLPPSARAAAELHLSQCAGCRESLAQERRLARSLADSFRSATVSLQLPPEVGFRVQAAMADERRGAGAAQTPMVFWRRLAWPLGVAACGLLCLAGWLVLLRWPEQRSAEEPPHAAHAVVSVQLSYVVPSYTFRAEGGLVIDSLSYHTNVVNERYPLSRAPSMK